jgi:hypothetical protein
VVVAAGDWFWQGPSWGGAELWALGVLALPIVIALVVRIFTKWNPRPVIDALTGEDGRWSTSKTGFFLWTYVLWFAFLAILFHTRGVGIDNNVLKGEYFVVLGIPSAAAVAAKGIVQSSVAAGDLTKTPNPGGQETNPFAGIGQLVSNDAGRLDLIDFQYFGFNLILIGFFLFRFLADADSGFPNLPDTLLALTGVGAAAYVGNKGTQSDVGPTIRSVVPPQQRHGQPVTVSGVNLATWQNKAARVTIAGFEAPVTAVNVPETHAEVTATVPADAPVGATQVVVVAYDGRQSPGYDFTVLPDPTP